MTEKTKNKMLLQGASLYAIGTFGTKILSFLIVPLYTYYIDLLDMGIYDVIMTTISLLVPIVTLQISDAAYKWIINDETHDKEKYIRATFQVIIINCSLAVLVIKLINCFVNIPYCNYLCIILILSRSLESLQRLLRGLKRQMLFAISGILYTILFLSFNVIQLVILEKGIESLFFSIILADALTILFVLISENKFRLKVFQKPDWKLIFEMYRFSAPLIPNNLNWWIMNSSDRYVVLYFLGPAYNGILSIANKFPTMLQSVLALFNNSWQDMSLSDGEKTQGDYYCKVFRKLYMLAFSSLWVLIPLTKIVIAFVMSVDYKSACDIVPFFYLGTVFQCFSSFYGVGYLKNSKTQKAFFTSVYGAAFNLVVNVVMISFVGLQAAAVSTFVGFFAMWLIREKQNRKELEIKINWFEFLTLCFSNILMCIISICFGIKVNIVILLISLFLFVLINYRDIVLVIGYILKKITARRRNI